MKVYVLESHGRYIEDGSCIVGVYADLESAKGGANTGGKEWESPPWAGAAWSAGAAPECDDADVAFYWIHEYEIEGLTK